MQNQVSLPGLEELVAQLAELVAHHGLGAVGGEPRRIVAGGAPTARVERRPPVRHSEERDGALLRGPPGVRLEDRRSEENPQLGACFRDVVPQGLNFGGSDGCLLPPAGDERPSPPRCAAHYARELKEIAPLRLGQGRAAMRVQLGDLEPDLAQLTHHQDFEILGRQVGQLIHRADSRARTGTPPDPTGGPSLPATAGVAPYKPCPYIIRESATKLRAPHPNLERGGTVCRSDDVISCGSPPAPARERRSAGWSGWA